MSSPVTAIILAGGTSHRMGAINKLLIEWRGKPLIRHVASTALASTAGQTIVVTGHQNEAIAHALDGTSVKIVHNPHFEEGMSTSLTVGIAALGKDVTGAAILLADMPMLGVNTLNTLIDTFVDGQDRTICVPVCRGRSGNPVIWPRHYFSDIMQLSGDHGGKTLMTKFKDQVSKFNCSDEGVLKDFDNPDDFT